MDALVDVRMVRTFGFTLFVSAAGCGILFFLYEMISDYVGIIIFSIISALPIQAMKNKVLTFIVQHYASEGSFSMVRSCLGVRLGFGLCTVLETPWKVIVGASVLSAYICTKVSLKSLLLLFCIAIVTDFLVRLAGDTWNGVRKVWKLPLNEGYVTLGTVLLSAMGSFVLATAIAGSIFYEIVHDSQWLADYLVLIVDYEQFYATVNSPLLLGNEAIAAELMNDPNECSSLIEEFSSWSIFTVLTGLDELFEDIGFFSTQYIVSYLDSGQVLKLLLGKMNYMMSVLGIVFRAGISNMTRLWEVILYFTLVVLQVNSQSSILSKIISVVPASEETKRRVEQKFNRSVLGLLQALGKSLLCHYIVTWVFYDVLGLQLKYSLAALSSVIALFPVCSVWVLNMVTFVALLYQGGWVLASLGYVFLSFTQDYIDSAIYEDVVQDMNSTLISIVIGLGLFEFGFMGIIYGPVLAALASILIGELRST